MKEVLIKDLHMDTLLYTPNLVATLKNFSTSRKKITLSRLKFEHATIRISLDTARVNNLKFIVDALKNPPDSIRTDKWAVIFNSIELKNSRFILDNKFKPLDVSNGINFSDLRVNNMDLITKNFRISNDTASFDIEHLSFKENSGFLMNHLEAVVYINKEFFLCIGLQSTNIVIKSYLFRTKIISILFFFPSKVAIITSLIILSVFKFGL